jgi:signal transduction histidine kinase
MINWRPELPLDGQAGIGVNGRNGFAQADSDFSGTLLAMAGHDLRQPLQVITSAHDVLRQILHGDKQREELARAADAAARLGSMLSQLVGALQLRERSSNHLPARYGCVPFSRIWRRSSPNRHGGRGSNFASSRPAPPSLVTPFC